MLGTVEQGVRNPKSKKNQAGRKDEQAKQGEMLNSVSYRMYSHGNQFVE